MVGEAVERGNSGGVRGRGRREREKGKRMKSVRSKNQK
jgi:hypothetical protein